MIEENINHTQSYSHKIKVSQGLQFLRCIDTFCNYLGGHCLQMMQVQAGTINWIMYSNSVKINFVGYVMAE